MQTKGLGICFCFCVSFLTLPVNVWAQNQRSSKLPQLIATQERPYKLSNELTTQAGYLPMDSFTKYFAVGAAFTHYYSDFLGWEIANANFAWSAPSGLEQELNNNYTVEIEAEDKFDVLNYYVSSNVVFTPLYTKSLLFDEKIVYGEVAFVAGPSLSKFDKAGFVGGVNVGAFLRFMLGTQTSLKIDVREHVYFSGRTKQNLMLVLGLAYNFGGDSDEVRQ